jgi:hypothetical protein
MTTSMQSVLLSDGIQRSAAVKLDAETSSYLGFNHECLAASTVLSVLIATGGFSVVAQGVFAPGAIAQSVSAPTVNYDAVSGYVQVDNNAFDLSTGPLTNQSNIPLPAILPSSASEGVPIPVRSDALAPNSIQIRPDVSYINQSFNELVNQPGSGTSYLLQPETLEFVTQFNVNHSPGDHGFGEGIQVTVFDPDCIIETQESLFVRGDGVQYGAGGQVLPSSGQLTAYYGANDTVELRVLNLREDDLPLDGPLDGVVGSDAGPQESAIYFDEAGEFIVEDFQNGGDLDFNDGDYVEISGGRGEGVAVEERRSVSVDTVTTETDMAPESSEEAVVETDVMRTLQDIESDTEENRIRGRVEAPDTVATRLGHARGAVSENNEQLVYDQYAAASEVSLGSDGLGLTGQLRPLASNPNVPPTLITANMNFNPTVGDNEAGFTTTLGITQFFNPTHRLARNVFGEVIQNPDEGGRALLEPAGILNNRRWVGYVPAAESESTLGDQLFSVDGIFDLPADQAVVISPADRQEVGPGNAAYTDNVGGLLIEDATGDLSFVPQWTKEGYAQNPITLEAGEAERVIYALVPQQAGQALRLGQTYAVNRGAEGYLIADGGFRIISADRQPQNFLEEMPEVYAVEDTLRSGNAANARFNGIPGVYSETLGSRETMPTLDVTMRPEVDARVGNDLFPMDEVMGEAGQMAYAQVTRSGGFYIGGAFTGGIGNQRDTIVRTTSTVERATDEIRTRRTVNTYVTPVTQLDAVTQQTTTTTQNTGRALFDINAQGELTNVRFLEGDSSTVNVEVAELDRQQQMVRGEAILVDSQTSETMALGDTRLVAADEETTSESDSYANFSAVQGELALGGVLNFGNTPWSAAANTLRAELFTRDTVFGRGGENETGWRAQVVFNPFGEVQREAYQYDDEGNAIALYKTEPVLDANGQQMMETLVQANGDSVEVPVNRFVLDEAGDRIVETVGTGRAKGPGVYVRLEDVMSDGDSPVVAGGLNFAF